MKKEDLLTREDLPAPFNKKEPETMLEKVGSWAVGLTVLFTGGLGLALFIAIIVGIPLGLLVLLWQYILQ